jgi:hypothetical protein
MTTELAKTSPTLRTRRTAMPSLDQWWVWEAFTEDSLTHRNPSDPDVAEILNVFRADPHFDEIAKLIEAGRDLVPPWEELDPI